MDSHSEHDLHVHHSPFVQVLDVERLANDRLAGSLEDGPLVLMILLASETVVATQTRHPGAFAFPALRPEPAKPFADLRTRSIGPVHFVTSVLALLSVDLDVDVLVLATDAFEASLPNHELAVELVLSNVDLLLAKGLVKRSAYCDGCIDFPVASEDTEEPG